MVGIFFSFSIFFSSETLLAQSLQMWKSHRKQENLNTNVNILFFYTEPASTSENKKYQIHNLVVLLYHRQEWRQGCPKTVLISHRETQHLSCTNCSGKFQEFSVSVNPDHLPAGRVAPPVSLSADLCRNSQYLFVIPAGASSVLRGRKTFLMDRPVSIFPSCLD